MSLKELAPTYHTRLTEVAKEINNPDKLLNAGCGDGLFDYFLKKKVKNLVSFDINEGDIQIAKALNPDKKITYYIGTAEKVPYNSDTFDCIICVDVLEHIKEDMRAIKELVRVLKKKGKLIITVPSKNFPLTYDPINYVLNRMGTKLRMGIWGWGHERLYTPKELANKVNLKIVKTKYLSHPIIGIVENSYVNSLLQRFTKNDPKNQAKIN
ncbi:class I SAM-dependent methyltransferase, partial [Candidatus Woesearchaeota archaeon]|nr:class I SAM-dependent methyltransferase [Candidatus Woesearchaeota archaeon]